MDAERLAAYLAGELDADETAAVEAALARDPGLRADLDSMRRADAALGSLAATELPAGFEARLRTAVDTELAALFGTAQADPAGAHSLQADDRGADELAARRARRSRSWIPAFAGAAATVAVVAGTLVGVGVLGGGDDATDMAAGDADTESIEMYDDGGEDEAATMALPDPGDGPTVVAGDRDLDDDLADELLASVELQAISDRALDAADGDSLGTTWRAALTAFVSVEPTPEQDAPAEEAEDAETFDADDAADEPELETDDGLARPAADVPVRVFADAALDDADLTAADRCLATVLAESEDAIPAYLELASYAGEPIVVVGLVTFDPGSGAYTRPEVWVLARDDCQVRRFSQG